MVRILLTLIGIGAQISRLHLTSGFEPSSAPPSTGEKASTAAMLTLGAGVASWLFLPFVAGVVGLIVGWGELNKIKRGESPIAGKSITQLGLVLSVINVVATVLGGCAMVVFYFGIFAVLVGGATMADQIPR